jgi:hypothetical protein
MRIHVDKQQNAYDKLWNPMEQALNNNLPEFIRHYLMHEGADIKKNDIYNYLKEEVEPNNSINYLSNLFKFSANYKKLIDPQFEANPYIRKYLERLNRIEVTTAYPLLLNLYNKMDEHIISEPDFIIMLQTIENYLIRRFVCGYTTNHLNKVFPVAISQLDKKYQDNYVEGLKAILQTRGYPSDIEFKKRIMDSKLYGAGNRNNKTKLILESIEENFGHKESVSFEELTIEHVMPQNFSEWWKLYYGDDWDSNQELYVHTIGNLTLTAYNQELSNSDYHTKKKVYADSHIELNKYFESVDAWYPSDIETRTKILTAKMLEIWPYFGSEYDIEAETDDVTGKTPQFLYILGQTIPVKSWRDVLVNTLDTIADLEPEKYEIIIREYPDFLGIGNSKFRYSRQLKNGTSIEVNHTANRIQKFCNQIMETVDLSSEEIKIEIN